VPVKAKNSGKKQVRVPNPAGKAGSPVSLHPLSFEEAVSGLGQMKMPETETKKPEAKRKKRKD
jgi:hypothetical protein